MSDTDLHKAVQEYLARIEKLGKPTTNTMAMLRGKMIGTVVGFINSFLENLNDQERAVFFYDITEIYCEECGKKVRDNGHQLSQGCHCTDADDA